MPLRHYQATPGYCIVEVLPAPEQTAGGIVIPETLRQRRPDKWGHDDDDHCWFQRGKVISLGGQHNFVEKWKDPLSKEDRERERFGHKGDIEVDDVVLFGWCGEELEPHVYRVKYPDVLAIDCRTEQELAAV